jgi:hypothetical protein
MSFKNGLIDCRLPDARKTLFVEHDVLYTSIGIEPYSILTAYSGTLSVIPSTTNHPGITSFSSSTTANSGVSCLTVQMFPLSIGLSSELIFYLPNPIDANTTIQFGFNDAGATTSPNNGAYFEIVGNQLVGKTANSGTFLNTTSSYTVIPNTWYHAKIIVTQNQQQMQVDYYLYNEIGTILWHDLLTSSIPSVQQRSILKTNNSGTTSVVLIYVDYINFVYPGPFIR